jgi:transcription termination/antitermination protein NusA
MFDLKVMHSVLGEMEQERGIPREKIIDAIETALATAYKKEYGKRGQIVRAKMDPDSGKTDFFQVKEVVDDTLVRVLDPSHDKLSGDITEGKRASGAAVDQKNQPMDADTVSADDEEKKSPDQKQAKSDGRVNYNPEHHILVEDARKIRRDVALGEEMIFPLESQDNFGRIASQTAKQVIIQKIREAERASVFEEFGSREGEIVSGTVQRMERGNIYVDLGRTAGILPAEEQIGGERYRPGERIRAYLFAVDESPRGVYLRLSRSHPNFLRKLFAVESPEISGGSVEIKAIAREPGTRSKIAVHSNDEHIDPVGSLVGQRGVRVSTVMSELAGERIDIIEWSADPAKFVEDALSPAKVAAVVIDEVEHRALATVTPDQQSLAIGRGGQNVRLAAKLTGWKIDIRSTGGEEVASEDVHAEVKTSDEAPEAEQES